VPATLPIFPTLPRPEAKVFPPAAEAAPKSDPVAALEAYP